MVYAYTKEVIIHWNPYQPLHTPRVYHDCFYEYNYSLSTEDKHTHGYLLLQKYPESILLIYYMHNYIPCELDVKYTPFCDTKILTYEVELLPSGKKIGFLFIG